MDEKYGFNTEQVIGMLEKLSNVLGVGNLKEATYAAKALLEEYCDDVKIDNMGNIIGHVAFSGKGGKKIMLEAHIDEVGFIVTDVDSEGFVHVDDCGRGDPRALSGAEVIVTGSQNASKGDKPVKLEGVFSSIPPHLMTEGDKGLPETRERVIDLGINGETAKKLVKPGDFVAYKPNFKALNSKRVSGKSMDDRAGVATILCALEYLKQAKADLSVDVTAVFAVEEELGCRGSATAAYSVNPDYAIAVDVSFAHTPDADPNKCGELGKGVMVGHAPTLDYEVTQDLIRLASEKNIPFQHEVMSGDTGTDADSIGTAGEGVRTVLLSVPLRYMHTPVEVVDAEDVLSVGRLMAEALMEGAEIFG